MTDTAHRTTPPEGNWKRRHALHLASQLPDDPADALDVLRHARELVETFLSDRAEPRVVRIIRGNNGEPPA